jgi:hypothetical protein
MQVSLGIRTHNLPANIPGFFAEQFRRVIKEFARAVGASGWTIETKSRHKSGQIASTSAA